MLYLGLKLKPILNDIFSTHQQSMVGENGFGAMNVIELVVYDIYSPPHHWCLSMVDLLVQGLYFPWTNSWQGNRGLISLSPVGLCFLPPVMIKIKVYKCTLFHIGHKC